jgi:uncharacterized protein YktA (UPF0223 family)
MKCEIEDYYDTDIGKTCYKLKYRGFCINASPIHDIWLQSAMRRLETAYNESMKAKKFKEAYICPEGAQIG